MQVVSSVWTMDDPMLPFVAQGIGWASGLAVPEDLGCASLGLSSPGKLACSPLQVACSAFPPRVLLSLDQET